jgi:hypothetical protein
MESDHALRDRSYVSNVGRRPLIRAAAALLALTAAGCAHERWQHAVEPDGRYCYVFGKRGARICTVQPIPSMEADRDAKRFAPDPGALTVYVVRHNWSDGSLNAFVAADSSAPVSTVPESMVRMRLSPGRHHLTATWEGGSTTRTVDGMASDVKLLRLRGSSWTWGTRLEWGEIGEDEARNLAASSRLVADLTLR